MLSFRAVAACRGELHPHGSCISCCRALLLETGLEGRGEVLKDQEGFRGFPAHLARAPVGCRSGLTCGLLAFPVAGSLLKA